MASSEEARVTDQPEPIQSLMSKILPTPGQEPFGAGDHDWEEYRGYTVTGADAERKARKAKIDEEEAAEEAKRRRDHLERTLGHRLATVSFDHFTENRANREALAGARAWLDSPNRNLILSGAIGTGKTYLMACMFVAVMDSLSSIYEARDKLCWLSAPEWIGVVRSGFQDEHASRDAEEMAVEACRVELLFLDDLGKVHPGANGASWLEERFYSIIDRRYRDALATVVTTEWTREALADRVGASVVSRLMDGAMLAPLDRYEWRKPQSRG